MLVYFAITLTALIGFCGLAVDVGRMELRTLQLQSAADAGALTGAEEYNNGNGSWYAAAATDATAVDTLNGITGVTMSGQYKASTGPYATEPSVIQFNVTQQLRSLFLGLLSGGNTYMTVSVRAAALPPPCMYLMGNPSITATTYDLWIASAHISSPCAVYARHGILVDYFSASYADATRASGAPGSSNVSGTVSGGAFYNAPVQNDPLAYVTAPTFTSCDHNGVYYSTPITIYPGTYCGGLRVTNTTVTMMPGRYIITGGVAINFGGLTGTGVTMYLTKGGGSGYGQFLLNYSNFYVSAPTVSSGGSIPGIVLFGDRNWTGSNQDFLYNYGDVYGDGIIYTTGTGMQMQHTNMRGSGSYFNIVTANIYEYTTAITTSNNYAALPGGNPFRNYTSLVQ